MSISRGCETFNGGLSNWRKMVMSDLEPNKRNVLAFYDLMFNQAHPREAIERYAGPDYIQHNPLVKPAFPR